MRGSSVPSKGTVIKDPNNYETGYTSCTKKNVVNYSQSYFPMAYFQVYSSHCSPTAAVNLMFYYKKNGYTSIINGTWESAFKELYDYMCTTASGTATWRIADGIKKYISSKGYTCTTATETQDPASLLTSEIGANRPVIINMTKHYYYETIQR